MKHLSLTLTCLLGICFSAFAQWTTSVTLTADSLGYINAGGMALDNDWHLHVFGIRTMPVDSHHVQGHGLMYLRFDNWGNPLGPAMEVLPSDTTYADRPPAIMLDRDGFVRAVWGRNRDAEPASLGRVLYVRISPAGVIVDGPRELAQGNLVPHYVPEHSQMIQGPDGRIYFMDEGRLAVYDSNMQELTPFHAFVPETSLTYHPVPSISPEGQVWIAFRCVIGFGIQHVALLRLDTLGALRDTVVLGTSTDENVGSESFLIDSAGVFHYVISRDLSGLSYMRDARDGTPPDTSVLDPHPWFGGETPLTEGSGDSLMVLISGGDPPFHRFVFDLQGHRLLTQAFNNSDFSTGGWATHIYRNRSHWISGTTYNSTFGRYELAMIHVPGPNEPADRADEHRPAPRATPLEIWPQPVDQTITLRLPQTAPGEIRFRLYNILGQLAFETTAGGSLGNEMRLMLPEWLPSGLYFAAIETANHRFNAKLVHQH